MRYLGRDILFKGKLSPIVTGTTEISVQELFTSFSLLFHTTSALQSPKECLFQIGSRAILVAVLRKSICTSHLLSQSRLPEVALQFTEQGEKKQKTDFDKTSVTDKRSHKVFPVPGQILHPLGDIGSLALLSGLV